MLTFPFPPNSFFFPTPYRGERYHLHDYRGRHQQPRGPIELFNYWHSTTRVIERCSSMLKAQFPVLKMIPNYPFYDNDVFQFHVVLSTIYKKRA